MLQYPAFLGLACLSPSRICQPKQLEFADAKVGNEGTRP